MKGRIFGMIVICAGLFIGCEKGQTRDKQQSPKGALKTSSVTEPVRKEIQKQQEILVTGDDEIAYEQKAPVANEKDTPLQPFQPFYVFSDKGSRLNHYIPSGFMPNGKCIAFNDHWMENCYQGATCIKIIYDVECSRQDLGWAGIFWQNPANNWGGRKGGFNLSGANKLTFWAKGEKGGEQIQEFIIGGIEGDYSDSDKTAIGPVLLMPEWRQYTIDLRGKDLSYISGGFAWSTSADVNPEACIFYLDEIKFE